MFVLRQFRISGSLCRRVLLLTGLVFVSVTLGPVFSQETELNDGEVSPKSKEGIFWGVEDCGSESCGTGLAKRAANPNGLSMSLTLEEIGVKS